MGCFRRLELLETGGVIVNFTTIGVKFDFASRVVNVVQCATSTFYILPIKSVTSIELLEIIVDS